MAAPRTMKKPASNGSNKAEMTPLMPTRDSPKRRARVGEISP